MTGKAKPGTVFVAVDIGCIECGEESKVLGIFRDKKNAQKVVNDAYDAQQRDWHGQHSFEVFEVEWPSPDTKGR